MKLYYDTPWIRCTLFKPTDSVSTISRQQSISLQEPYLPNEGRIPYQKRICQAKFSPHGEKARTGRGGAQPYAPRRQAEGPEAEGNQVVTRNAPSGGAVRPPALRQPSEIKNSFVQWTKEFSWQREKDSNPHIRSQSPLCYPYTIPLCSQRTDIIIAAFSNLSIGK